MTEADRDLQRLTETDRDWQRLTMVEVKLDNKPACLYLGYHHQYIVMVRV